MNFNDIFLKDQLKFVYDTLEEFVICRKTWFPVSELSQILKAKSMKDPHTKINEYQREFLVKNNQEILTGINITKCVYFLVDLQTNASFLNWGLCWGSSWGQSR